ncbi:hypothetical protein POTOM_042390 [Populus tomentosa]|uniref:Uncharacterized protein n=1 Tax=Populus tomentosa TaxID=118781 RepID=A0A8X7YTI7_POPTO|nr:hypothetical protein POTOM_042390 [Populus tomentosa]
MTTRWEISSRNNLGAIGPEEEDVLAFCSPSEKFSGTLMVPDIGLLQEDGFELTFPCRGTDNQDMDMVVWHYCIDHHWYNLLSASSAVLLVSIADFMGPKSRGSIKLQTESYVAVPFGAGGMSVMAEWVWPWKLKSLRCFMSGSENMELAQQGKSLISYLLAAIAMGSRKHGLANSFILSQANLYIERNCVLG